MPWHDLIGKNLKNSHSFISRIFSHQTRMSVLDLPLDMLVEVATYLGTTESLANFTMTCSRIYRAFKFEKIDRKRLPHFKIRRIWFDRFDYPFLHISVNYDYLQSHGDCEKRKSHSWDFSDPTGIKLYNLTRHWLLEDTEVILFYHDTAINVQLLECLSEMTYANPIRRCYLDRISLNSNELCSIETKVLPLVQKFLKKVGSISLAIGIV